MNWLDIILLVILFLHLVSGYTRGLVRQLFDVLGFIVVIVLSIWGSRLLSGPLSLLIDPEAIIPHHDLIVKLGLEVALEKVPQLIAGILIFLLLLLFLSFVFKLFSRGFKWVNRVPVIGFFNRLGGAFIGLIIGFLFIYIIIGALSLIPLQHAMSALKGSEVVFLSEHYLNPLAAKVKEILINYYLSLNGA